MNKGITGLELFLWFGLIVKIAILVFCIIQIIKLSITRTNQNDELTKIH